MKDSRTKRAAPVLLTLLLMLLAERSLEAQEKTADPAWFGLATQLHFDKNGKKEGLRIAFVWVDSPAAKAGLLEGDILISARGQMLRSPSLLVRLVKGETSGATLPLVFRRDGKLSKTTATLGSIADAELDDAAYLALRKSKRASGSLTEEEADKIWQIIANDAKATLLDVGVPPEQAAQIVAAMAPARAQLLDLKPAPKTDPPSETNPAPKTK